MKKIKRFLAAAAMEGIKYLLVLYIAAMLGNAGSSLASRAFFAYLCLPHLLFGAGFFFLWLDFPRYSAFKILLLTGKCALALPGALFILSQGASAGGRIDLSGSPPAMTASVIAIMLDLIAIACLLLPASERTKPDETDTKES